MSLSFKQATLIAFLLSFVVVARVAAYEPPANKQEVKPSKLPKVAVTVSKETTYITEPLRKDGSVDYVTALDQRAHQGVTLENNSAVLFWQAVGPGEIWEEIRDKYFQMLGIPTLPEKGDYFVNIQDYLANQKDKEKIENAKPEESQDDVWNILDPAKKRPWSKQEIPLLAQWLEANEKPLSLIVQASKRPKRYDPLVGGESALLIGVPFPFISYFHHTGNIVEALIVRAMLRLNEGKTDEAWDDLLACHRLARLMGQGPMMVDFLIAGRIEETACEGDLAFLQNTHLTSTQATKMRNELLRLAPMPKMVEKFDVAERYTYLDCVSYYSRTGLPGMAGLFNIKENKNYKRTLNSLVYYGKRTPIDWDVSLRMGNACYDHIVEAYTKPTRPQQKDALRKIKEDFSNLNKTAADTNSLEKSILDDPRKAISERLGQVLLVTFGPEILISRDYEDRYTTRFELDKLAFSLAAYRADIGIYPMKLGDLVPKYLAEVPKDICNDTDLHYRKETNGFLLYSVGNNGRDDGAKSYDDRDSTLDNEEVIKRDEDWDDLVVRIPAAKAKNKSPVIAKGSSKKDSTADSIILESLKKKIQLSVMELGYSEKTAQDFFEMTTSWEDYIEDRILLIVLNEKLSQAEKDYKNQKITKDEMSQIEEEIVDDLNPQYRFIVTNEAGHYSLDEIIKDQKANCLGFTQLFYILGNSIGLSVKPIWVDEMFDYSTTPGQLHAANLVYLTDNKVLLVDLAFSYISEPFVFDEHYKQVGNYWQCKNKRNTLQLHPKIQILDQKGLAGCIHYNRGCSSLASKDYNQAITDYTKAIELNYKFARAYLARGFVHFMIKNKEETKKDLFKAVELDPSFKSQALIILFRSIW